MPTTLPVPSKGALRALRNLALGTSCTVAVGAGLLTEDRRRRIHTARQVYENAQTLKSLKSSRHYHGAGAIESFEEQALRHSDDAFWLPSNVARSKLVSVPVPPAEEKPAQSLPVSPSVKTRKPLKPVSSTTPIETNLSRLPLSKPVLLDSSINSSKRLASSPPQDSLDRNTPLRAETQREIRNRQHRLALDITELLDGADQPSNPDAATSKFLEAFEHGLKVTEKGMYPILVDAAIRLLKALPQQFDIHEKILLVVSQHAPIDEAQFEKFSPNHLMNRMMKRVRGESSGKQYVDEDLLKATASIYLTPFTSKPTSATNQMQTLGERLCAATCQSGLYDLTTKLFTRLELQRGERPVHCVQHLIEAVHASRQPQKSFRYFKSLYTQTSPDQVEFFKVGNLVLDALLKKGVSAKFEEFLGLVTQMAESNDIQTSTSWFLKVLGYDWRTNQDISRTRALFERMLPQLSRAAHPQAVYGAIIQFCIEAGEEPRAMDYYMRLSEIYPETSKDVRIMGHLAFAKALRGDWDGVRADLQKIHCHNPTRNVSQQAEYSAIFTPILKKFAESHHITQTEEFVRKAVDEWQLRITPFISNVMVGVYSGSKEIDPMIRWIELAASVGCQVEAATINTLFRKFAGDWKFSFLEVNRLYHQICKLDEMLGTKSTNAETVLLLEKIALSKSRNDDEARKNLSRLKNVTIAEPDNSEFVSSSGRIYRDMVQAYIDERLEDVLQIYNNAQAGPIRLGPKPLLLAVKAMLKSNGESLEEAAALIKQAQDNGQNISDSVAKVMVYRIERLDERQAGVQAISDMARDDIKALEARGINVPDTVLTHAMSVLVRRGRYRRAIDMWQSTSHYLKRNPSVADLFTLTVLLEAYIGIQFNSGIRWVIKMLSENKLAPDAKFYSVLNNARRSLRKTAWRGVGNKTTNYRTCIEKACERVEAIRLALKEEKVQAKYKIIKVIEMAAQNQEASLSAKLIGVRKDLSVLPKGTKKEINNEPISVWGDSEELEFVPSLSTQRVAAGSG